MNIRARATFAILAATLASAVLGGGASADPLQPNAGYSGYASGTVLHTNALIEATGEGVARADIGFSAASANPSSLSTPISNEMGRLVQPLLSNNQSYGAGSGTEVKVADVVAGAEYAASAAAPGPTGEPEASSRKGVVDLQVSPAAYAGAIVAQANANWVMNQCVIGKPISSGLGRVALAQLVDLADSSGTPELDNPAVQIGANGRRRGVADSYSEVRLVQSGTGGSWAVSSETRMTIAPVTVAGTTVEFLGEWVLRAVATGTGPGQVHFGPGTASPDAPVLRIIQDGSETRIISLKDITDLTGKTIEIPGAVKVTIGEDPHAIGGAGAPVQTANEASAAVDVARIDVNDPTGALGIKPAHIRVGHMEVRATAPDGGISCPALTITKTSNPETVKPGDNFTYTITVTNPNSCELHNVRLTDSMDLRPEAAGKAVPAFTVTSTGGANESNPITGRLLGTRPVQAHELVWNDIEPIAAGASVSREIGVSVGASDSVATAHFTDDALVQGTCTTTDVQGNPVDVTLYGQVQILLPVVCPAGTSCVLGARIPRPLPRTGIADYGTLGLALLGGAGGLGALGARLTRRRLRG